MRFQAANSRLTVYVAAGITLVLGFAVALRVMTVTQYSISRLPSDKAASDILQRWDDLESNFQARIASEGLTLGHDPLWPTYVARAAPPAAKETPVTAAAKLQGQGSAAAGRGAGAPPSPALPRLMALLLDRETRALLQQNGKSRIVRPGDRFGGVQITAVGPEGVTVEYNGARRLLSLH